MGSDQGQRCAAARRVEKRFLFFLSISGSEVPAQPLLLAGVRVFAFWASLARCHEEMVGSLTGFKEVPFDSNGITGEREGPRETVQGVGSDDSVGHPRIAKAVLVSISCRSSTFSLDDCPSFSDFATLHPSTPEPRHGSPDGNRDSFWTRRDAGTAGNGMQPATADMDRKGERTKGGAVRESLFP
ncbi:hypothetical protein CCHR01_00070 [Colletotrichum chrysophilum]|uniref:Uncharacterized protein n=1 Tax=Colletotrichum chrysophilum TaxID=1836956 RepID=A0AAD9B1Y9_9PEZI|nr:hypothetical protein CCHR01_00070 [Colletotrichum chrysophilum]